MSKETAQDVTSMDDIWEKIDPGAREAWENQAVQAAVIDPKVQTMVGLLPYCTGTLNAEDMTGRLEGMMGREYDGVPPARYEEVFTNAGMLLMRRELGLDGEA
jgi:hypothetical protein